MSGAFRARPKLSLEDRVIRSAERALEDQHSVSTTDVLMRMGLLPLSGVTSWRQGRIPYLEDAIQGGREKIARSLEVFQEWARDQGLESVEARYSRATREGEQELQFTNTRYAGLEQALRSHYVSPQISERKRQSLQKKVSQSPERVVYLNLRDSTCSECGVDLPS